MAGIVIDTRSIMPPRAITIAVAGLDEVRQVFDRIQVWKSTTTATGTFVETTTPITRLQLQAAVHSYPFVDPAGTDDAWYKVRFYNTTTDLASSFSEPIQGAGDTALDVLSVEELKDIFLFGVTLSDSDGAPFPPALFEFYIKSAVSFVERYLDIPLRPLVIVDETQDFYRQDYYTNNFIQLNNSPVRDVQRVQLILPTGQQVIDYDPTWIKIEKDTGQLQIVPGGGNISSIALGLSGQWLTVVNQWADFIPQLFHIDYTAGFEKGQCPYDLREVVGMLAALGPLHLAGDLILGAGIASEALSMDGLSQSIATTSSPSFAGYGARTKNYVAQVRLRLPTLRRYFKGVRIVAG